jgi:hypothetical protein
MNARQTLENLMRQSASQLKGVLNGLKEDQFETSALPTSMSPRQTVEHLMEVCHAVEKIAEGQEHEWGTFQAPNLAQGELLAQFWQARASAVQKAADCADSNPDLAGGYIAAHEFYHVGQLVSNRMHQDPEWNSYSIYDQVS